MVDPDAIAALLTPEQRAVLTDALAPILQKLVKALRTLAERLPDRETAERIVSNAKQFEKQISTTWLVSDQLVFSTVRSPAETTGDFVPDPRLGPGPNFKRYLTAMTAEEWRASNQKIAEVYCERHAGSVDHLRKIVGSERRRLNKL
jgi:hypothetical protein